MPTFLEFLHSAAEKAGRYDRQTTTSVGTTSTLVCSRYANTVMSDSEFANFAVLIESGACAGEMGMVTNSGLDNATGTLELATTFTSLIASGVTFSLYPPDRLPPYRVGHMPGWLEICNQALARVWIEDTITIVGVSDQKHYTIDQTVYPWFTDDTRIIEIQQPVTNADDVPTCMSASSWTWVSDGETRRLRFNGAPFRTGQSFTIKVNRPANSRLKLNASLRAALTSTAVSSVSVTAGGYYTALPTIAAASGGGTYTAVMAATPGPITSVTVGAGGTHTASQPPAMIVTRNASDTGWADQTSQTAGLVTLTDEAIPDVRFVRPMMLALGFEALAEMGAPGQTVAEWMTKSNQWAQTANRLKLSRMPRDPRQGLIGGDVRYGVVGGRRGGRY